MALLSVVKPRVPSNASSSLHLRHSWHRVDIVASSGIKRATRLVPLRELGATNHDSLVPTGQSARHDSGLWQAVWTLLSSQGRKADSSCRLLAIEDVPVLVLLDEPLCSQLVLLLLLHGSSLCLHLGDVLSLHVCYLLDHLVLVHLIIEDILVGVL